MSTPDPGALGLPDRASCRHTPERAAPSSHPAAEGTPVPTLPVGWTAAAQEHSKHAVLNARSVRLRREMNTPTHPPTGRVGDGALGHTRSISNTYRVLPAFTGRTLCAALCDPALEAARSSSARILGRIGGRKRRGGGLTDLQRLRCATPQFGSHAVEAWR